MCTISCISDNAERRSKALETMIGSPWRGACLGGGGQAQNLGPKSNHLENCTISTLRSRVTQRSSELTACQKTPFHELILANDGS